MSSLPVFNLTTFTLIRRNVTYGIFFPKRVAADWDEILLPTSISFTLDTPADIGDRNLFVQFHSGPVLGPTIRYDWNLLPSTTYDVVIYPGAVLVIPTISFSTVILPMPDDMYIAAGGALHIDIDGPGYTDLTDLHYTAKQWRSMRT